MLNYTIVLYEETYLKRWQIKGYRYFTLKTHGNNTAVQWKLLSWLDGTNVIQIDLESNQIILHLINFII